MDKTLTGCHACGSYIDFSEIQECMTHEAGVLCPMCTKQWLDLKGSKHVH